MSRLIEPTAGEIEFDGEDLRAASERELVELRRHKMGMVFQHFALFPHRTVLDNVAFPLEVQGVDLATRHARALEIIDLVGLHGRGNYYPRELSGGQQQRVGIGRSLAVEPDVWFLDEPFSALDALIRRDMQDEFLRLQSTLQKTIIFITHDFDEAIRLADRIAIMRDGVIDQMGTAEELITNPGSDYVAAFTKNVSRAKLLRVHTLMGPPSDEAQDDVDGRVFVASVANQILSSAIPLRVVEDGEVVGSITAAQVTEALFEAD
jgi:glycine betaine/proline transport system ATP-binding protein